MSTVTAPHGVKGPRVAIWRRLVLCLGAGLALGLILSGTWIYVSQKEQSGPETFELVIPPGTSARIAAGDSSPSVPSRLELRTGDRLVVQNDDVADHQVGTTFVSAGTRADVPLGTSTFRSQFVCTFHGAGQIDLDVAARKEPSSLLLASLIVGVPLGLATFGVTTLAARL